MRRHRGPNHERHGAARRRREAERERNVGNSALHLLREDLAARSTRCGRRYASSSERTEDFAEETEDFAEEIEDFGEEFGATGVIRAFCRWPTRCRSVR